MHDLITAYAVNVRGAWSLLIINKDPSNAMRLRIASLTTGSIRGHFRARSRCHFGAAEYSWHSSAATSHADPTAAKRSTLEWQPGKMALLPKALSHSADSGPAVRDLNLPASTV